MKTALKTSDTSVRLQERADVVARTVISQQASINRINAAPTNSSSWKQWWEPQFDISRNPMSFGPG